MTPAGKVYVWYHGSRSKNLPEKISKFIVVENPRNLIYNKKGQIDEQRLTAKIITKKGRSDSNK